MAGLCQGGNESPALHSHNGRQQSLKCAKGKRDSPVCTVVQQEEVERIPASSYECTMVHSVFRSYNVNGGTEEGKERKNVLIEVKE
ncbi:hypothetical protein ANN_17502 [Periplaneta americana]|uniref:Uncharacterized protein n=1 Tax=Periplaneta americana TaxID=6978 RepID=A0ABQ8SUC0_PERAM|nr:hypothetical protein ANN_17502 [Periplaneta americana]